MDSFKIPGIKQKKSKMALKRIRKEIIQLQKHPIENIEINFNPSDIYQCEAFITGPQDSPYEGHVYKVVVQLPTDYPFHPPEVKIYNIM